MDRCLASGYPVIIGSEPAIHWICLGGRTANGEYVWADSAYSPALGACPWDELKYWFTVDADTDLEMELEEAFEAIAILPGANLPSSRSIVPWVDGIWEVWTNDPTYARNWSNLLADMLDVFWDKEFAKGVQSAGDFIDKNLSSIVESVSYQSGSCAEYLHDLGQVYRDVAEFHSLVVPEGQEVEVITSFALKLLAKAGA